MSDIAYLSAIASAADDAAGAVAIQAAEEIRRLEARVARLEADNARLRAALEPFARRIHFDVQGGNGAGSIELNIRTEHVFAARRVLEETSP